MSRRREVTQCIEQEGIDLGFGCLMTGGDTRIGIVRRQGLCFT